LSMPGMASHGAGATVTNPQAISLPVLREDDPDELAQHVTRKHTKKEKYYRAELPSGREIALGVTPDEDWIDVVARKQRKRERGNNASGPFATFGFHVVEGRWLNGQGPPGASELRTVLAMHFGTPTRALRRL